MRKHFCRRLHSCLISMVPWIASLVEYLRARLEPTWVHTLVKLGSIEKLQDLCTNIRLGCKWLAVANAPDYSIKARMNALKSFIVKALVPQKTKLCWVTLFPSLKNVDCVTVRNKLVREYFPQNDTQQNGTMYDAVTCFNCKLIQYRRCLAIYWLNHYAILIRVILVQLSVIILIGILLSVILSFC